jgi:S1-C subfamily serine protease
MRARPGSLALVALVAAVIGGVAVLVVGKATGWISTGSEKTTVIVRAPALAEPASATRAVSASAKPLSGNGFDPRRIYQRRSSGVVTIHAFYGQGTLSEQEGQGSGFVVSANGYVLTNSHVITNAGDANAKVSPADELFVEFRDGDRVGAKVVGWDVYDDVGLIKIDPRDHPVAPVPLGVSARVQVGDPVAAIGSPFGNVNSLSVGVVSATGRSIPALTSQYRLVDAIQTDAAINHGNSGGPLFDARGRVIGINAQIRTDTGAAEGVGFAVPIDSARRSMEELIAAGRISYAYMGIEAEDLIPSIARRFGYSVLHGAVITSVHADTPAAAAGLRGGNDREDVLGTTFIRGGDVIVGLAGRPVRSADDVVRIVADELSPGQSVTLTFLRRGDRRRVKVELAERPSRSG